VFSGSARATESSAITGFRGSAVGRRAGFTLEAPGGVAGVSVGLLWLLIAPASSRVGPTGSASRSSTRSLNATGRRHQRVPPTRPACPLFMSPWAEGFGRVLTGPILALFIAPAHRCTSFERRRWNDETRRVSFTVHRRAFGGTRHAELSTLFRFRHTLLMLRCYLLQKAGSVNTLCSGVA
jgi:hypothetical protein